MQYYTVSTLSSDSSPPGLSLDGVLGAGSTESSGGREPCSAWDSVLPCVNMLPSGLELLGCWHPLSWQQSQETDTF